MTKADSGESLTVEGFEQKVRSAIKPLTDALTADGYALEITHAGPEELDMAVVALDGACADCLAPREVFVGILFDALTADGVDMSEEAISVSYPSDH